VPDRVQPERLRRGEEQAWSRSSQLLAQSSAASVGRRREGDDESARCVVAQSNSVPRDYVRAYNDTDRAAVRTALVDDCA
jgi:hypothetical protein